MTFPLTGPSGSRRPDDGESRILRQRLAALEDARDRAAAGGPAFKSARQLVKVIDQGHIPTTPDKFFACNPCDADGAESEGTVPSFDCDQDTTLYVDFLGQAPAANDMAVASAVGGRWVAEAGRSEKKCGCLACNDQIPATDLTLTIAPPIFTGNPPVFPGTSGTTLLFNGSSSNPRWERCIGVLPPNPDGPWTTPDGVHFNIAFRLSCGPLFGSSFSEAPGCFGADVTLFHLVSSSVDPFELVFLEKNGGFVNGNFFDVTYTVTGPPLLGNAPKYCVTICATLCASVPLPDSVVTIADAGGKTVATGKTTASGCVTLDIGKKGTYTVTVAPPGYPPITQTKPLTCTRYNFDFTPANTFCCASRLTGDATTRHYPIPENLFLTTSLGTVPFNVLVGGPGWVAQQIYTPDDDIIVDYCTFGGRCFYAALGRGSVLITYIGNCSDVLGAGPIDQFNVRASWSTGVHEAAVFGGSVACLDGEPARDWHATCCEFNPGSCVDNLCAFIDRNARFNLGISGNTSASLTKMPSSVYPGRFTWSGTLSTGTTCPIPPVLAVAVSS